MPPNHRPHPVRRTPSVAACVALVVGTLTGLVPAAAQGQASAPSAAKAATAGAPPPNAAAKAIGLQIREALKGGVAGDGKLKIDMRPMVKAAAASANVAAPTVAIPSVAKPVNPSASRQAIRARAAALAARTGPAEEIVDPAQGMAAMRWEYEGANGPQAWGRLHPEFAICALGQRQSPINIDESITLRGPAEAIEFDYRTSSATVVNNGYTIQADVTGDNGIFVRGSRFQLVEVHFHHPGEERINHRSFAMVAHLVHRNHLGQSAIVAVLLEPGPANPVINAIWTYMPLGKGDRVPMPVGSVELAAMLPKDRRYYQFMGSQTTPPCTEDVLWIVLKQPVTLSHEQLRLFAQQFPNNARPVQATNGRVVREAQ